MWKLSQWSTMQILDTITVIFIYHFITNGSGPNIQARTDTARPGPINAFETPINRQKINLIRTFVVLHQ